MRLAPAATFSLDVINGSVEISVESDFWIAETKITYELWYEVRNWAMGNGYTFANAGQEGSHGVSGQPSTKKKNEPVTMINWRDCIVWCNALSEFLDYDPVYRYHHLDGTSSVIRDAAQFVDLLQERNSL